MFVLATVMHIYGWEKPPRIGRVRVCCRKRS